MWLRRIEIQGFRNLHHTELNPSDGYNLITGNNGSGKSSLLETLHVLSTGRSFRTSKKQPIIQHGANEATLFAEVVDPAHVTRAGMLKRRDGSSLIKLDGRTLESQAELALLLPIIGSTPESEDLLEDGSKARQSYLDWSLFHVEQAFRELWRSYRRVLQQRNRALKGEYDTATVRSWDAPLVSAGIEVDRLRKAVLTRLLPHLEETIQQLLPDVAIHFSFRQGWPRDLSFSEALDHSFKVDRKMGFTHSGPHRADILFKTDGGPLTQTLSRGQKKLLTLALKIGQARDYIAQTGNKPILYIDDLAAELDYANRQRVISRLLELHCQFFITATAAVDATSREIVPGHMFHVEQGRVTNMV